MTDNGQPTLPVQAIPDPAPDKGVDNKPETLSLTSAQLKERLDRAENAALTKLLKKLGVENVEALEVIVPEHKTLKSASLTDAEKLTTAAADAQAKLTAEASARAASEAKVAELEAARIGDRIDAAIKEICMTPAIRAEHPQDVVELIRKGNIDGVVDDKGQVVTDKVKALVEQAKKDRPGWFKTGGVGSPSNRDGVAPEALAAEKEKARRAQAENLRHKF